MEINLQLAKEIILQAISVGGSIPRIDAVGLDESLGFSIEEINKTCKWLEETGKIRRVLHTAEEFGLLPGEQLKYYYEVPYSTLEWASDIEFPEEA